MNSIKSTKEIGQDYEQHAERYLQQQGLSIIEKNYRCRAGEIDLIMRDRSTLVFIEVKARNTSRFGSPAQTVTKAKQQKVIATAKHYLAQKKIGEKYAVRFDVLGILHQIHENPELNFEWIPNAFD